MKKVLDWVASFTDAWIETVTCIATHASGHGRVLHGRVDRNRGAVDIDGQELVSRPSRARGSKPLYFTKVRPVTHVSRPSRARGSKRVEIEDGRYVV